MDSATHSYKCFRKIFLCILISLCSFFKYSYSQCPSDITQGQNLIINGDFSQGYTGWTHDSQYQHLFSCGTCMSSHPGIIYAGAVSTLLSVNFKTPAPGGTIIPDHTTSTGDNMMLMVDGLCTPGIKLWEQSNITIEPNTNYFFTVSIATIKTPPAPSTGLGILRFDFAGVNLPLIIMPTSVSGAWVTYTATTSSGPTATVVSVSIENLTTQGCTNAVDFAIDDISLSAGCQYGAPGPLPALGADQVLCGTTTSISLNTNISTSSTTSIIWSDGITGTGLGAPYLRTFSVPGTYSVCVWEGGSCKRSDAATISVCPLSIQFSDLDVGNNGEKTEMRWRVYDSKEVKWFVMEKSTDGQSFSLLDTVGHEQESYAYFDSKAILEPQLTYYRIKAVSWNGEFTYSPIRQHLNETSNSSLFKNVGIKAGNIQLISSFSKPISGEMVLFDGSGKILFHGAHEFQKGENLVTMNMISAGVYYFSITTDGMSQVFKVISID